MTCTGWILLAPVGAAKLLSNIKRAALSGLFYCVRDTEQEKKSLAVAESGALRKSDQNRRFLVNLCGILGLPLAALVCAYAPKNEQFCYLNFGS